MDEIQKNLLEQVAGLCEKLRVYEQDKQQRLAQCRDPEEMGRIMSDNYK